MKKNNLNREEFPGEIEQKFRLLLGQHNHHLNMLEISIEMFSKELSAQTNKDEYIRELAKKLGYHSLHPQKSGFENSRKYLTFSHIAYLFSAGDAMCNKVRSHSYLKGVKGKHTSILRVIDKGDFIRKTVNLVILSSQNEEVRDSKEVLKESSQTLSLPGFSVLNYYRLVRNEQLHTTVDDCDNQASYDVWENLEFEAIKDKFKIKPNQPDSLSVEDALLCSKAWQDAALWLCSHMLNIDEACIPILKRQFGRLGSDKYKQTRSARQFMKQKLLLPPKKIDDILDSIQWNN